MWRKLSWINMFVIISHRNTHSNISSCFRHETYFCIIVQKFSTCENCINCVSMNNFFRISNICFNTIIKNENDVWVMMTTKQDRKAWNWMLCYDFLCVLFEETDRRINGTNVLNEANIMIFSSMFCFIGWDTRMIGVNVTQVLQFVSKI